MEVAKIFNFFFAVRVAIVSFPTHHLCLDGSTVETFQLSSLPYDIIILDTYIVLESEVVHLIQQLIDTKASGYDTITRKFIKKISTHIVPVITFINSESLLEDRFSDCL